MIPRIWGLIDEAIGDVRYDHNDSTSNEVLDILDEINSLLDDVRKEVNAINNRTTWNKLLKEAKDKENK